MGNLLSRVTAPKLVEHILPVDLTLKPSAITEVHPEDATLNRLLDQLPSIVEGYMDKFQISRVPEAVVECLNEVSVLRADVNRANEHGVYRRIDTLLS
jgi:hypothetical protein